MFENRIASSTDLLEAQSMVKILQIGSRNMSSLILTWVRFSAELFNSANLSEDVSVGGSKFSITASPSLADISREIALIIPHPTDSNRTLWDMRKDSGPFSGPIATEIQKLYDDSEVVNSGVEIGALGSGSDYTVRLGVLNKR